MCECNDDTWCACFRCSRLYKRIIVVSCTTAIVTCIIHKSNNIIYRIYTCRVNVITDKQTLKKPCDVPRWYIQGGSSRILIHYSNLNNSTICNSKSYFFNLQTGNCCTSRYRPYYFQTIAIFCTTYKVPSVYWYKLLLFKSEPLFSIM